MDSVGYILAFAAGALVGGLCSYRIAADKADERADLEIEEMRKYFMEKAEGKKKKQREQAEEKSKQSVNKPNVADLKKPVIETKVNYTMYSEETPDDPVVTSEPVLLGPDEEFGEREGYSKVFLTYYSDEILVEDSTLKVMNKNDVDKTIGRSALDQFDSLTPSGQPIDLVQVRNDRLRSYFEIARDEREYSEAVGWEADDDNDY